jgi:hypothetical protein
MNRILGVLSTCVAAALLSACAGMKPDKELVCGESPNPTVRKLKFSVDSNGCVVSVKKDDGADGNTLEVCRGDTIQWKVKVDGAKNGDKEKLVAFDKGTTSPCAWKDSSYKADSIEGKVRTDADFTTYEYSVRTKDGPNNGCPLDPMIIVRR